MVYYSSLHSISSDKRGLNLDYLPFMRKSLTDPLVERENEGVKDVIEMMDSYNIIKEDFDNVMEVSKWPNSSDPFSNLSSKVSLVLNIFSMHCFVYLNGVLHCILEHFAHTSVASVMVGGN